MDDNKVHPVETQWHYPILTKYGFEPQTKEQKGFVRSYIYSKNNVEIKCTTGVHSDRWENLTNKAGGYWSDLEPHLKNISAKI